MLRVLKGRDFPAARLATFEADQEEPDLPVLDRSDHLGFENAGDEAPPKSLDVLFLAARARTKAGEPSLLGKALEAAGFNRTTPDLTPCLVIDSADALCDVPDRTLSIPSLETAGRKFGPSPTARVFASPHPAMIVLGKLLFRLAERIPVKDCVAQVFLPASELGPRAIEELQRQTVNLLSFQKIPERVFGAQLAFNLLSRLPGKRASEICDIESRIRRETRQYLVDRVPLPALHCLHVPVFHSLAFSVYVELQEKSTIEALSAALAGGGISTRRRTEPAPTQADAGGSAEILVDAVTPDPDRAHGYWIWATVDNIRLAAENAVDIAEALLQPHHPKQ
jgi:aspartate-semialdehyde dehydrogenase